MELFSLLAVNGQSCDLSPGKRSFVLSVSSEPCHATLLSCGAATSNACGKDMSSSVSCGSWYCCSQSQCRQQSSQARNTVEFLYLEMMRLSNRYQN